jgi:DNA-binding transcriptional regulator LsrR (DeoR family)
MKAAGRRDISNKRIVEAYELYKKHKNKKVVAKKLNISAERARQLLAEGSRRGLFKYAAGKKS